MERLKKDLKSGILYRSWPAVEPRAIFLLVHGLGAHSARWNFLAEFFLQKNISSYAIELRGFGETEGLKGHVDSFNAYFKDICCLRDIISKENSGKKVFLIGESLGAVISLLLIAGGSNLFDGLICVSPAFVSKMKVSLSKYIRIFASLLYNPKKQFGIPFTAGMCTRDAACQKLLDEDKKECRVATSRFILETFIAQTKSKKLKDKIKLPALFLLAGEDKLVDIEASRKAFKSFEIKDKTLIEYPLMYHALSIALGREKVFEDILKWAEGKI